MFGAVIVSSPTGYRWNQVPLLPAGLRLDRSRGLYYTVPDYDPSGQLYLQSTVLQGYYERATSAANTFTTGANLDWRARRWLTVSADAGLNLIQRADETYLPSGIVTTYPDSGGHVGVGRR